MKVKRKKKKLLILKQYMSGIKNFSLSMFAIRRKYQQNGNYNKSNILKRKAKVIIIIVFNIKSKSSDI